MTWPLDAAITANGYTLNEAPNIIRTQMEQGADRKQRIATQYSTFVDVQCHLTAAELNTFRTYYEGTAAHGAAWFDMDIITTQGVATHQVRIESASVSFITNDFWLLQMTLETEEHIDS